MYTSISEAFPMAMNEEKSHGLQIVTFDVSYRDGVVIVDQLDCEALIRETILFWKIINKKNWRTFKKKSI